MVERTGREQAVAVLSGLHRAARPNHTFDSPRYTIVGGVGLDNGEGNPSVVWPYVGANYFHTLGIQPFLGRFLLASDEHGNNSVPYIVLSYAYWHSQFHSDPATVGRMVQINQHPYIIAGVAPPDFRGTELFFSPDLWAPVVDLPSLADGTRWKSAATISLGWSAI